MIPTKATIEKVKKANQILIDAKNMLIEAENLAVDMREKIDIAECKDKIQKAIFATLNYTHPQKEFDAAEWLKNQTVKDKEYLERLQKILDDAVTHIEENEKLGKE